jgi:hypothetical protein
MGSYPPLPVCGKSSVPLQGEPLAPLKSSELLPIRDALTRRFLNGVYGKLPEPLTRDMFTASNRLADQYFPPKLSDGPAYDAARENMVHLANLNTLLAREILPQHVPVTLNRAAETMARQTAPQLAMVQKRQHQLNAAKSAYDQHLDRQSERVTRQLVGNLRLNYSLEGYPHPPYA